MKKIIFSIIIGICVSCGDYSSSDRNVKAEDLFGKEFVLTNIYEEKNITIAFIDTNQFGGYSAVNNYFTEFNLDGNKIILEPERIALTKMAGSEEDMIIEDEYLRLLSQADTIALDGDVLTITTTSGTNLVYSFSSFWQETDR